MATWRSTTMLTSTQAILRGVAAHENGRVVAVLRRASGRIETWRGKGPGNTGLRAIPILGRTISWFDHIRFGVVPWDWAGDCLERDDAGDDGPVEQKPQPPAGTGALVRSALMGGLMLLGVQLIAWWLAGRFVSVTLGTPGFEALTLLVFVGVYALYMTVLASRPDLRAVFQMHGVLNKAMWARAEGGEPSVERLAKLPVLHPMSNGSFLGFVVLSALSALLTLVVPLTALSPFAAHVVLVVAKLALFPLASAIGTELGLLVARACIALPALRPALLAPFFMVRVTVREPDAEQLELGVVLLKELR